MRLRSGVAVAMAKPTAAAPIQALAWGFPYALNVALKRKKKKKTFTMLNCSNNIPLTTSSKHFKSEKSRISTDDPPQN